MLSVNCLFRASWAGPVADTSIGRSGPGSTSSNGGMDLSATWDWIKTATLPKAKSLITDMGLMTANHPSSSSHTNNNNSNSANNNSAASSSSAVSGTTTSGSVTLTSSTSASQPVSNPIPIPVPGTTPPRISRLSQDLASVGIVSPRQIASVTASTSHLDTGADDHADTFQPEPFPTKVSSRLETESPENAEDNNVDNKEDRHAAAAGLEATGQTKRNKKKEQNEKPALDVVSAREKQAEVLSATTKGSPLRGRASKASPALAGDAELACDEGKAGAVLPAVVMDHGTAKSRLDANPARKKAEEILRRRAELSPQNRVTVVRSSPLNILAGFKGDRKNESDVDSDKKEDRKECEETKTIEVAEQKNFSAQYKGSENPHPSTTSSSQKHAVESSPIRIGDSESPSRRHSSGSPIRQSGSPNRHSGGSPSRLSGSPGRGPLINPGSPKSTISGQREARRTSKAGQDFPDEVLTIEVKANTDMVSDMIVSVLKTVELLENSIGCRFCMVMP